MAESARRRRGRRRGASLTEEKPGVGAPPSRQGWGREPAGRDAAPSPAGPSKRGYHHGDLRAALVDTAVELIAERGVHGFSLSEASRRLGVTVAAPYRHFADREELLAAVATRAAEQLGETVGRALASADTPEAGVAALAEAYVRFAADERPLFATLFGVGLDKQRYPELEAAAHGAEERLMGVVRQIVASGEEEAADLMLALVTATHGAAALMLDGFFGDPEDPQVVAVAVRHAVAVTRAVLAGRHAL